MQLRQLAGLLLPVLLFLSIATVEQTVAVRPKDFKKCGDSSFCRRIRRLSTYAESHGPQFSSPYRINGLPTFDQSKPSLKAQVKSALHPEVDFELEVRFHNDGTARVRMDEVGKRYGDWKRYDEAEKWGIDKQPDFFKQEHFSYSADTVRSTVDFGPDGTHSLALEYDPIKLTFSRDGVSQVVLNGRGLLHMEHFRQKPDPFPSLKEESDDESEEGAPSLVFQTKKRSLEEAGHASSAAEFWAGFEEQDKGEWKETFAGREDSKPKGPEALSLDIEFPGKSHIFGLPEHASPLNLRSTRGEQDGDFHEPYRLMNTDVFEYDADSPMSLYGSVPVVHAVQAGSAASILWLSGSETWIDVDRKSGGSSANETARTHFFSESGILDLFVFLEPTPEKNMALFSTLVGKTPLPALFALGYHQCRWNYLSTDDVLTVNGRFSDEDIPMDVIWLDIEYAKNHWYGVWNEETFPKPERMLEALDAEGRKLVIIIDPHLARNDDYFLYKEALKKDVFVKMPDEKSDYEGWCWSGSASWLDGFHPDLQNWWNSLYNLASKKLKANARNMHFWLDMNEPAIFNGPEITAPKDVKHYGNWEHRDVHNIYSVTYHAASTLAAKLREAPNRRPFTLARGWWIGSWKHGAIWTGDNLGTWEHLAVCIPMMLANNIGGMSFCGCDIGGFFGNPNPEMLVRWYQAGIFEPFFRAHAHIDTKRREPHLLDEPLRSAVRDLIKLRYKMLPTWYTAFKESSATGLPVLRPQFLVNPHDAKGFSVGDQYFIGDSGLLVKPAVQKDATKVDVYLGEDRPFYNFFTHEVSRGSVKGKHVSVPAPMTSQVPMLQRGGSIVSIRERVRRSAELGWRDPFTLYIALDAHSQDGIRARGRLYLDDGQTYANEEGDYLWKEFEWRENANDSSNGAASSIVCKDVEGSGGAKTDVSASTRDGSKDEFRKSIADVRVERIVILGLEKAPRSIKTDVGESIDFTWKKGTSASGKGSGKASVLTVKDPKVRVLDDWVISLD